jgi:heat shock protein HslJ
MENNMKQTTFFLIILLALLLSACSGGSISPEGEWTLVSYGASAAPTPALPDVETSINFGTDGEVGGTVGCNTFGGEYKVNGEQVTFSGIFSTLMFCEGTSDQESAVLAILSDKTLNFSISGNQLTLISEDGASIIVLAKK